MPDVVSRFYSIRVTVTDPASRSPTLFESGRIFNPGGTEVKVILDRHREDVGLLVRSLPNPTAVRLQFAVCLHHLKEDFRSRRDLQRETVPTRSEAEAIFLAVCHPLPADGGSWAGVAEYLSVRGEAAQAAFAAAPVAGQSAAAKTADVEELFVTGAARGFGATPMSGLSFRNGLKAVEP